MKFDDLQKLNADWKADYVKQQLCEDVNVQKLMKERKTTIDREYEDLAAARIQVYDVLDEMPAHQRQLEEGIKKRKIEVGITKTKYKEGYFKEFDIMDMYKVNGKVCYTCYKGLKCKKHDIKHTEKPMNEQ